MIELIDLLLLDGRTVHVNAAHIASVSTPKPEDPLLTPKVHCIVTMANGRFVSVVEDCASLRKRLEGHLK